MLAEVQALRAAYDEERTARVRAEQARMQLASALEAAEESRLVAEETIAMLEERIAGERVEAARERHASALALRAQRESMELEVAMLTEELRQATR